MSDLTGLRSPLAASVELAALREEVKRLHGLVELVLQRLPIPPDILTTAEVKTLYGLSESGLYQLSRRGILKRVKRQGRRGSWWLRDEIETYLRGMPESTETRGRRRTQRGPARASDLQRPTLDTTIPEEEPDTTYQQKNQTRGIGHPRQGGGFRGLAPVKGESNEEKR